MCFQGQHKSVVFECNWSHEPIARVRWSTSRSVSIQSPSWLTSHLSSSLLVSVSLRAARNVLIKPMGKNTTQADACQPKSRPERERNCLPLAEFLWQVASLLALPPEDSAGKWSAGCTALCSAFKLYSSKFWNKLWVMRYWLAALPDLSCVSVLISFRLPFSQPRAPPLQVPR